MRGDSLSLSSFSFPCVCFVVTSVYYVEILDLLNEESVSGARSGRASL